MSGDTKSAGTGPEQCEDQPGHNPDGGEDHPHAVHHWTLAHWICQFK